MMRHFLPIILLCAITTTTFAQQQSTSPPCYPPEVPQYIPDHGYGTYCKFNGEYSQIDFVFLIEVSKFTDDFHIQMAQKALVNSMIITKGKFSNDSSTNNAAFVIFSKNAKVVVPFGTLTSYTDVANTFTNMLSWKTQFGDFGFNYTAALQFVDTQVFDYGNDRAKMLILIGDNGNQLDFEVTPDNVDVATGIKNKGVKIFTIGYSLSSSSLNNVDTMFAKICTPGWYFRLLLTSVMTSSLYNSFSDKARQTGCICPAGTRQYFAQLPSTDPPMGPYIAEYYKDCFYSVNFMGSSFTDNLFDCNSYYPKSRLVAIDSEQKWNFIQSESPIIKKQTKNIGPGFWSGKNDTVWVTYSSTTTSAAKVTYLPSSFNDPQIQQQQCQNVYSIKPGPGGIIVPFGNGTCIYCSADFKTTSMPFCEALGKDSYDNPRLCH